MSAHAQLAALGSLAAILMAIAGGIISQGLRQNPGKRERRRRLRVNRTGRSGDALITEVSETLVYYTYSVHGVYYSASQDIAALREKLPPQLGSVVGPANIKYSGKNPANSIVVCEEWSGLRKAHGECVVRVKGKAHSECVVRVEGKAHSECVVRVEDGSARSAAGAR